MSGPTTTTPPSDHDPLGEVMAALMTAEANGGQLARATYGVIMRLFDSTPKRMRAAREMAARARLMIDRLIEVKQGVPEPDYETPPGPIPEGINRLELIYHVSRAFYENTLRNGEPPHVDMLISDPSRDAKQPRH